MDTHNTMLPICSYMNVILLLISTILE